ncbi:MAG: hypothetical protein ABSG43_24945, partial [Solirubrobacteraceae bacterium]
MGNVRRRQGAWRRYTSGWSPAAVAIGALLILYAGWQLAGWPAADRNVVGDAFDFPFDLAAIVAACAAAHRCREVARLRCAWRLVALALICNFLADVTWTVYELAGSRPYPSLADGFYLAFYPLLLWGLLRFPGPPQSLAQNVRLGLDMAVIAIGGAIVVIDLVLGPTVLQSS